MLSSLAALLLAAAAPDTTWGAIRGSVLSEPGGTPLPSAVVEATTGGRTLTDSTGAYLLSRVAAGRQTLRVHSIDHEPFEVDVFVPARGEVVLGVSLRHRPLVLDTVRASGGGVAGTASDPAPRSEAALTDFPAFEGPGGLEPAGGDGNGNGGGGGSGEEVLMVRGAAADLKLVLLDGAPVYAPFHMAGLIESFEPGLLSRARLYLGGAPARYDGGVSYVLDLATRGASTERWSGGASADMVAVRGEADGPLWKGAGLLLASRAVHGASLGRLEGEPFPYSYADGLARLDVSLGRGARLAVTGFTNREGVRVDTTPWPDNFLRWSNAAGSARLRGLLLGEQGELTVAFSAFDAQFPIGQLMAQSHQKRARVALDFTRELGALRLGYGYAWDRRWADHTVFDRGADKLTFARDTFGTMGGWYLDGLWRAAPGWLVRGGVRGDMFAGGPFLSFSPRLALTWLMTPRAALTLAGGRYHQLVLARIPEPIDYGDGDVANRLHIPTVFTVASGTHLTLALDQQLAQGVRLGLEGYFKRFRGIDPETVGDHASGVDVWVRRGEGAVSGWMGYSLAWYWARLGAQSDSGPTRPPFAGRQTVSAGLAAQGRHGRAEVRLAYGSGLPYSSVGSGADPSAPNLPETPLPATPGEVAAPLSRPPQDFLRIDVQLSRTFTPRLRGHETALTPYVRVMNALDRRDNLFYRYGRAGDLEAAPTATLPILPVFGLEWKL
ncbi:MAG: carboxypeptidase regulatory-like domain-containing protein [Longimicrobiaceae bacterium]